MVAFETSQGISLLPQVAPIAGGGDPRIDRVSALGGLLESNTKIKNGFHGAPVKTPGLVKSFGTIEARRLHVRRARRHPPARRDVQVAGRALESGGRT